jgi:hypothetical protein
MHTHIHIHTQHTQSTEHRANELKYAHAHTWTGTHTIVLLLCQTRICKHLQAVGERWGMTASAPTADVLPMPKQYMQCPHIMHNCWALIHQASWLIVPHLNHLHTYLIHGQQPPLQSHDNFWSGREERRSLLVMMIAAWLTQRGLESWCLLFGCRCQEYEKHTCQPVVFWQHRVNSAFGVCSAADLSFSHHINALLYLKDLHEFRPWPQRCFLLPVSRNPVVKPTCRHLQ